MKAIGIENFRVFADNAKFDLPGITALIGPNSSGKSSVIKLLKLLNANIDHRPEATDEFKIPIEKLDFRGSDHYLGNFKTAKHRNGDKATISISFYHDAFNQYEETKDVWEFKFSFVEDFQTKVSNALLSKLEICSEQLQAEQQDSTIFKLDLMLNSELRNELKNKDIISFINSEYFVKKIHEYIDYDLLDTARDKTPFTGLKPTKPEETYLLEFLDKLGYIQMKVEDLYKDTDKELLKPMLQVIDGATFLGNNPNYVYISNLHNLKHELHSLDTGDKEGARSKLKQNLWPTSWGSAKGSSYSFRWLVFKNHLFDCLLHNFDEWQTVVHENRDVIEWLNLKLTKSELPSSYIKSYLDFYQSTLTGNETFKDLVDTFRIEDSKLLKYYLGKLCRYSEPIFSKEVNLRQADNFNLDFGFTESEIINEYLEENLITSNKLSKKLSDFMVSILSASVQGGWNQFVDLSNSEIEYIQDLREPMTKTLAKIQNTNPDHLEQQSEKKLWGSFIESSKSINDLIFGEFKSAVQNISSFKTAFLNSERGASDRVYSDQDQSSEWRKLVYKLADLDTTDDRLVFINKWIKEFGIADNLYIARGEDAASSRVLLDHDGDYSENIADLGFGISQLLPIIVKIAMTKIGSLMVVEEPEANLHPAYQSKLADLFVEAREQYGHKFLLETHSEYLIRKLQFLIGIEKLDSSKANIYYFNPKAKNGSTSVKNINFLSSGGLTDTFGSGFFDESSNLKLDLVNLTHAKN